MDAVQQLYQAYGLTLNAVELTSDELLALRYPMIAALDLNQDRQADHYVVVTDTNDARIAYKESDGTRESLPTSEFLRLFTGFALVASADSYGRLLSQTQARSITGGRRDNWGEYLNIDSLFEPRDYKQDLIGLGITVGS